MYKATHRDALEMVADFPEGQEKRRLVRYFVETGQLTDDDLAFMMRHEMEKRVAECAETLSNNHLAYFLWERLQAYPERLARALAQLFPDVFYTYGYAYRMIFKLRANLGPVVIPPIQPNADYNPSVFMAELPESVKADLLELHWECVFRDYLYCMSREEAVGFALLDEAILSAETDYDRALYERVRDYCKTLRDMTFPQCMSELNGSPFPSFHVRWWIDYVKDKPRVLNMSDTGTQKTAFATVAMDFYGARKVLVVCTANGRRHWGDEIEGYFRVSKDRVFVIESARDAADARTADAQFIVVAYSTLIHEGVVAALTDIPFDSFIWDEWTYGKRLTGTARAERALACSRLLEEIPLKRVMALSATPFENHPRELAVVASMLHGETFKTPEEFLAARPEDPRFLRELMGDLVFGIELREVKDLPDITPEPWKDLFGATLIPLSPPHRELYEFVREDDTARLRSGNKADRLLQAAVHPHTLREHYSWPEHFDGYFENPELSTKLLWLKERLTRELALGAKIVVGTGIHVAGITRELPLEDSDILWVGGILREWFGERCVLCLDGSVPLTGARGRQSARTALIERWRSDPDARILLISMRACPDTINLTVPALPGIRKLFITALSFGWKPWKQFLGRFFREGQGVPVSYEVPVLDGTIDMSLLRLLREKWEALELFLAHVPLTEEERTLFSKKESLHRLIEENRSSLEYVNVIGAMMLGRGETGARARLTEEFFPGMTNAALYARSFEASREYNTSGHITRFIVEVVRKLEADGLVELERILDAGCGPLTLERSLAAPVYGVDLNAAMIETGRSASLHAGENARVGALSEMPAEWTHLFELTVCSLVLDWSSVAERTKILGELVRVTHPHGRILLTLTRTQLTEALLHAWTEALQEMDCVVIEELTGLVRALDGSNAAKERFQFWSICFSPNGRPFRAQNPDAFRLAFEVERSKIRRGDENGNSGHHEKEVLEHRGVVYREFEVVQRSGVALQAERAGELAAAHEVGRAIAAPDLGGWKFHRTPANLHWRVLQELVARGLVDVGGV